MTTSRQSILSRQAGRSLGLEKLRKRAEKQGAEPPLMRRFRRKYRADLPAFVHDCVDFPEGEHPTAYQDEILAEFLLRRRVAVRGPHGIGKTALAAWVVLWAVLTAADVKVPTTASVWRQLTKYLWPEVHKWAARLRWPLIGREPFTGNELMLLSIRLSATSEAFAVAATNPAHIEGAHAERVVYIYDEAKTIPEATFDASEGAFAGAGEDTGREAFALALSTPGEPLGRFYAIHARQSAYRDWWARHVTLEEAIAAGRISRDWAEQRRLQWGESDPRFQTRALGEFAAGGTTSVIPLAWVERAQDRWRELRDQDLLGGPATSVGADVGEFGDQTVLAPARDLLVLELRKHSKEDVMQTTGRVVALLSSHPEVKVVVDTVGIGSGVGARLREIRRGELSTPAWTVLSFSAGKASKARDRTNEWGFADLRAAAWWYVREMLDPANGEDVALPADDQLTGDLIAPTWRAVSGGKIRVESKADISKRITRSTDCGDAVVMALAGPQLLKKGVFLG